MDNFPAITLNRVQNAGMSVSVELVKLREKYGWSQDEAASLAGVAPTTWYRAERTDPRADWSKGLRRRTLRTMLESLLNCAMPIGAEDALIIADAAGIPRTAIRVPAPTRALPAPPTTPSNMLSQDAALRLVALVFEFAARVGAERAESVLRQITDIPMASPLVALPADPRAQAAKAYLRVFETPRQRADGSVEQVVKGYDVVPSATDPTAAAKRPTRKIV